MLAPQHCCYLICLVWLSYDLANVAAGYEGQFLNNLRHGKGVYSSKSNARFEGEFQATESALTLLLALSEYSGSASTMHVH